MPDRKNISPISDREVKRHTVSDIVDYIFKRNEGEKVLLTTTIPARQGMKASEQFQLLLKQGFTRIVVNNETIKIEDYLKNKKNFH